MASEEKTTGDVPEVHQSPPPTSKGEKVTGETAVVADEGEHKTTDRAEGEKNTAKDKCAKKRPKRKQNKSKKHHGKDSSSESSDDSDGSSTSSSSSSDSLDGVSDADEVKKGSKSKAKKSAAKRGKKTSKTTHGATSDSDGGSSSADQDPESEDERPPRHSQADLAKTVRLLQQQMQAQQNGQPFIPGGHLPGVRESIMSSMGYNQGMRVPPLPPVPMRARRGPGHNMGFGNMDIGNMDMGHHNPNLVVDGTRKERKKKRKASKLDFKRVDQVWDSSIHNYKLQDTAAGTVDTKYDEFLFHVRRTFDWEGKYKATIIDIKSKVLRDCLQEVMGNVKGVSLVEGTPKLDPNLLFLYLEDLRKHTKTLKKTKATGSSKADLKKEKKRIKTKRRQLRVLVKYIDTDYADVKKSLYPMLANGIITFDLLWALWKPNTLAYTTTYGSHEEPRVFKVELAEKHTTMMKGDFYFVDGKYLEYDGRNFGFGSIIEEIGDFRGARKITSLKCYPLAYHKSEATLRKELIERGKKFVGLNGVHYRSHQGLAYYKKKRAVVKVNINGRIMVDPSTHRRINPNYPISMVRPKELDCASDEDDSDDSGGCDGCGSDSEGGQDAELELTKVKSIAKIVKDALGKTVVIRLPKPVAQDDGNEKLDQVSSKAGNAGSEESATGAGEAPTEEAQAKSKAPEFTDDEYLIASPVVLGFAFGEKLWLEFTVSGVKDIQWNEHAYESLVLESKTKDIVRALVESHKYHAAESIDDVIQGKGRGLVAVLHGPPGTGKTLTAEGISELLKCPLYMVSAGELGTDSRYLENELQKILDICHAWGAILLLDEADVFLEKRNMHDIHRNALVSIFLRQLEYFQGILFLTTNRVETFDDAFQSRIHIALRYENLDYKAKKAIFKIFIERVRVLEKSGPMPFTEEDLNVLARYELNGRQIKNTVRTAQALAVNKSETLSMSHISQVLEVQMKFQNDLAGGPGYQEAMRSYC